MAQARTATRLWLAAAAALWANPLCAGVLPGFALVGQSERISVYSRESRPLDAGKSERYLRRLEGVLGLRLSGRVEYYRCERAEDVAAATGIYATGVTAPRDGRIYSVHDYHPHELVHALAGQLGSAGAFFDEGLAVAVSGEAPRRGAELDRLAGQSLRERPLSRLVAGFEALEPRAGYALAGSFVAFLIEAHGVARVVDFLRECGRAGADRGAAFQAVFGQSLDEAGAAWRQARWPRG